MQQQEWDRLLAEYLHQDFWKYITTGIRQKFRIGFNCTAANHSRSAPHNMSAREIIKEYLSKKSREGRVLGLPSPIPICIHKSRFGIIPKGTSGLWCIILDTPSPDGSSGNGGITISKTKLCGRGRGSIGFYGKGTLLGESGYQKCVPEHSCSS